MSRELLTFGTADLVADWVAVDDRVMGGASRSRLRFDAGGYAVFEGVVSLENNGGFASVRSRPCDFAAAGATAYLIDVRGDGRQYKFAARLDDAFDGVGYQLAFEPPAGVWSAVRLPLGDFRATFRGRNVPDAPRFDPARVRQIGLVIADRQAGPFVLALRSLRAQ